MLCRPKPLLQRKVTFCDSVKAFDVYHHCYLHCFKCTLGVSNVTQTMHRTMLMGQFLSGRCSQYIK
jgi:hypothetical protein